MDKANTFCHVGTDPHSQPVRSLMGFRRNGRYDDMGLLGVQLSSPHSVAVLTVLLNCSKIVDIYKYEK